MARTVINLGGNQTRTVVVGRDGHLIPAQFTGSTADDDPMANPSSTDQNSDVDPDSDPENDDIEGDHIEGDDIENDAAVDDPEDETEADDTEMGKHAEPAIDLDLDEDPDTALVGSLSLHMLSEHGISGALHLDEAALIGEHQRAHREHAQVHGIADLRFRPTRALAAAMLQYSEEETPPLTAAASV